MRFEVDDKGHPTGTYVKVARDANKLVEEFMLLANRSVAELVGRVPKGKKAKVLPYRIHDVPDPEKLEKLRAFIAKFGYRLRTEGTKTEVSKSLNALLDAAKGQKEEKAIEMVALRAMMKARYSTHNIGHYGLMFQYYTHFTSPIRRYPDTMVHRLLTRYAGGGRSGNQSKFEEACASTRRTWSSWRPTPSGRASSTSRWSLWPTAWGRNSRARCRASRSSACMWR